MPLVVYEAELGRHMDDLFLAYLVTEISNFSTVVYVRGASRK